MECPGGGRPVRHPSTRPFRDPQPLWRRIVGVGLVGLPEPRDLSHPALLLNRGRIPSSAREAELRGSSEALHEIHTNVRGPPPVAPGQVGRGR